MREQVIETGPRTPPADPAQADTLSAWSSFITGFELTRKPTISLPLTSLDPTDYRYCYVPFWVVKLVWVAGASARCVEASPVPKFLRARPAQDGGEDRKIRRLAGARHAPADWSDRARIVALSWDGLAAPAIAAETGSPPNTVRRWRPRCTPARL